MSETPLYDALLKRAEAGFARFHMPGHKGRSIDSLPLLDVSLDLTEIEGTGSLYEGIPPISDAEALCAKAWGAKDAFFLTGGSSQGVRAAVAAGCKPGGTLICDRSAHISLHSALVMLDLRVEYIPTEMVKGFGAAGPISAEGLDRLIERTPDACGIFITSPTYYGVVQDIPAIASIAEKHGLPLIVDEAHGAHFPFCEGFSGAVAAGADLAVCSMHKTLPALGQSALVTSSGRVPGEKIREACRNFGSTSPSYIMMANMDICRAFMYNEGRQRLKQNILRLETLSEKLRAAGFAILSHRLPCDPARLTLSAASVGFSGHEAKTLLEGKRVVPEMADSANLVFIISPFDSGEDFERLERALLELVAEKRPPLAVETADIPLPVFALRPREAALSDERAVRLENCAGLVASRPISLFPPGIQLAGAGETITQEHIALLTAGGITPEQMIFTVVR